MNKLPDKEEIQVGDLVTGTRANAGAALFGSRQTGALGLIVEKYSSPNHYRRRLKVLWFNFKKSPLEQCDPDELRKLEIPDASK